MPWNLMMIKEVHWSNNTFYDWLFIYNVYFSINDARLGASVDFSFTCQKNYTYILKRDNIAWSCYQWNLPLHWKLSTSFATLVGTAHISIDLTFYVT